MIGIGTNLKFQPSVFKRKSGASLEYLFAENGSTAPHEGTAPIVVTRAGATASRWKIDGTLDTAVPASEPRIDHDPSTIAFQNLILKSQQFNDAVWVKSGGASASDNTGIAPDGTLTASTATFTSSSSLFRQAVTLTDGATYTFTIYARSLTGDTAMTVDAGDGVGVTQTVTGSATRLTFTVVAGANDWLDFRMGGAATVEIWGAQLNTGSTALPYKQTVTATLTEYACKGLLIEEARTNSIRNNSMQGAAAGTPGTLPTNWTSSGNAGLARQVVGIGTEDGIDYIDVRYSGTVAAVGSPEQYVVFDGANVIAASSGQTWTSSFYSRVVGGSLTGVVNCENFIVCHDGASALTEASSATFTPNSSALKSNRSTHTRTLTAGSTQYIHNRVDLNFTAGATVDVTLRIGLPQLEQGASASSVIRTTSAAVTRNADVCPVNQLIGWFNANEGTLLVEGDVTVSGSTFPALVTIHDGTPNNIIYLEGRSSSSKGRFEVTTGGANQVAIDSTGSISSGVAFRLICTYKQNDFAMSLNGAAVQTDTSGSVPAVTTMHIGSDRGVTSFTNGHIRRLAYFPRRLTNTELQQYTT